MYNICHITSVHPRYDIRILIKECSTIVQAGYNVTLLVADDLSQEVYQPKLIIDSVGKPKSRISRILITTRLIYKKVLALNPDIVHLHDPELLWVGLKLAHRGFKVIYDVHEDLPKQIQNKHWIPVMLRPVVSKVAAHAERFICNRISGVVTATETIAKRFIQYNHNTIAVCNYPLLAEFHNSALDKPWNERTKDICYVGSISKSRGIIPLINSLAASNMHLELAGIISSDLTLSMLFSEAGFEYVNYLGILNRAAIIKLLAEVKIGIVTLLPTASYVEALPIKLFEYMLAGIPVVASNFAVLSNIVEKYNCGVVVDPANAKEIAQACLRLLNNPELATTMGQNGAKAVKELFNWESESKKILQLYSELLLHP